MEKRIALFVAGCCALWLFSCLDENEVETTITKDCQILSFSLSSDSIKGVDDVVFAIDQVGGYIFNIDSMPYGTVLNEKVICTFQRGNYVVRTQAIQTATGDTIDLSSGDSLDLSQPVTLINTWADGITIKAYRAWVNIHQTNPDSMVWSLYQNGIPEETVQEEKVVVCGEGDGAVYYMFTRPGGTNSGYGLYRSPVSDGHAWTKLNVSGLPADSVRLSQLTVFKGVFYVPTEEGLLYRSTDGTEWTQAGWSADYSIRALLGSILPPGGGRQDTALTAAVETGDSLVFAKMTDENTGWETGNPVSEDFPLSGFGNLSFTSSYKSRASVVAGRGGNGELTASTWSTEDGLTWIKLTDEKNDLPFDAQEGVAVVKYDNEDSNTENSFFLLGGIGESGKASSEIYFSRDGGINWSLADTSLIRMPGTFKARGFASIHVDADNYIYLFGGKENPDSDVLNEIWRGRINRLGF